MIYLCCNNDENYRQGNKTDVDIVSSHRERDLFPFHPTVIVTQNSQIVEANDSEDGHMRSMKMNGLKTLSGKCSSNDT